MRQRNEEQCQSYIKMDLKELYILSFYFHAYDFIIRTKVWFYKIKGHMVLKCGQLAPPPNPQHSSATRVVMSRSPFSPHLRNRCSISGSRAKKTFCKKNQIECNFPLLLSVQSASQLHNLTSFALKMTEKIIRRCFQFAYTVTCIPNFMLLCNNIVLLEYIV